MRHHAAILITLVLALAPATHATAQSCTTWNSPPINGEVEPPVFDQLRGELAVTFERHRGSPGNYNSTFRVEGSAEGTNNAHALRFLQLRIKGSAGVYIAVPIPNPLTGPVTISAGVRAFSNSTPERVMQLVAASDDTDKAIWTVILDEITLRTPDPQGSIAIPQPTCLRDEADGPCTVDVVWESTNVANDYQFLYVTVESPAWSFPGKMWRRLTPDLPGGDNSGGVKINSQGVTFRLWASNHLYVVGDEYDNIVSEALELDSAHALSIPSYGIINPIDGQPMHRDPVEPDSFLGILANGMFAAANPPESMDATAQLLADAGMSYIRRSIRWDKLPLDANGEYDWAFYDTLFFTFGQQGIEPWITLTGMRNGAGDPSLGVNCDPDDPSSYPLAEGAEHLWIDFVSQAVARYGPGGVLPIPCTNWEVWQEPDVGFFCGDFVQWRRLHDLANVVLDTHHPGHRIWAPNIVVTEQRNPDVIEEWIDNLLFSGIEFDGFALHCFFHHGHDNLALANQVVRSIRARLDDAYPAQHIPLFVTACSHLTPGDKFGFRRRLSKAEQEQFYIDLMAVLANAGAEAAMWFDAVEFNAPVGMLSPNLGPPDYHLPNPPYCGALRVSEWLVHGP